MFVASCSGLFKKKDSDAGTDASAVTDVVDASVVPAPAALATNEGDIARFPDETKLADVAATLQQSFNVREAPPSGVIILGLAKGTAVTQIASREKSILVVFDNPKAPGTKLMGWIHRDAFSAVVADAGAPTCAKGEIPIFSDTRTCGKPCSADSDCPSGQACKGSANKILPSGKAGDGVTVCTIFHPHDAGAPPPAVVDAGKPAVVDAGKPVDAGGPAPVVDAGKPAVVDAGKPPTPTGPAADVVAPGAGGKCPDSFVLVAKTGKCHRSCATGKDLPERLKSCRNANPLCIKCDKDQKFVCAESQTQCR